MTVGPLRVAILTVSDAGSRGEREDTSGDAIARWAGQHSYHVAARTLVPDETSEIVRTLVGSMGLVLAVPITGLIASLMAQWAVRQEEGH